METAFGKPFTSAGFGNLFRDWCNEVGYAENRGAMGCARPDVADPLKRAVPPMAVSRHRSLKKAEKYVRAADQVRLARSAIASVLVANR